MKIIKLGDESINIDSIAKIVSIPLAYDQQTENISYIVEVTLISGEKTKYGIDKEKLSELQELNLL